MDAETLERRYAEARDALLIEFGTRWVERKPLLMSVQRGLVIVIMVLAGYTGPRFFALLGLYALTFAFDLYERHRIRRTECTEHHIAYGTMIAMFLMAVGCAFTGGYASPILPALLAPAVIPAAAFGRRPPTWILLGELVVLLLVLLGLPEWVTGPIMPKPWVSIGIGTSIVFAVWVSVVNLVTLTEVYTRAAVHAAQMREEVLEQHESRARGLETMGAKVAHELKNPLAAIAGLAQLLLQGQHDDKTRERLSVIASEVGRMEKTMREYLAFSRPLDEVRPMDVELATLADDVLVLLEGRARARSVTLERTGERLRARVDPARLKEALINLVDNAIEASSAGGRVTIELARVPGSTHVRVRDRGEGIAPEVLARVGTPYFTTRSEGTGLGVVIARAAIEQHGGTLALHSQRGEGTLAEIVLPDAAAPARAA
ncbi:sensor histidine kinase [Sandaracinus amylolyticus]|uniref:sensor histidine kinase n=1 Tax=Sandaracinus amylolyticus TaxID=927083 RepID=UPI001F348616|nr:HAMP domain-containing sensor histidine kinase [Sandaracinus amylolyticus]UJR78179.1 Integral membrane sensor signal transduction histidine kinase [Sandaracinus amylolyticus]